MTTYHVEKPGWKTYRNSEPEPNGDMQKINSIAISQLIPQTNITQYKILFDEAHIPHISIFNNAYSIGGNGKLHRLQIELLGLGHFVEVLEPGLEITTALLSNYDLLVIPYSYGYYDTSEINTVRNWVESGGNILILAEYWNVIENDSFRTLVGAFDYELSEKEIYDTDDTVGYRIRKFDEMNIRSHPITTSIGSISMSYILGIINKPIDSQDVIITDNDDTAYYPDYPDNIPANNIPVVCAQGNINSNGGRLVLISATNLWDTAVDPALSTHNIMQYDNMQFAKNTFNWLVERNGILSIDTDGDTLTDYIELYYLNSNPNSLDSDNDNLTDLFEYQNGMKLYTNDTDSDGLWDYDEFHILPTDPKKADTDDDQLIDGDEYFIYGTNATCKDTDIDGIPDGYEVFNLMDPLNETDAELDYDNDLLTNLQEYKFGGNVYSNDSDSDGLSDSDELYIYFTKINRNDTDFDGLMDWDEIFIYFTDPRDRDTDDDNYSDRLEILEGWDPLDPDDPVPRPWVSTSRPTVQISISIFSILVIIPLIPTAIYIKRKKK
ncbi:MAG: DUF4350 domain-containing protein [Candidatus Heimdallarchaeota archaeon]|nr:DUF4350 domain-containing protein [Candidatus Heimdallarchaeota archaeon]MCG3253934.1 hypothetical protein [Candidatus Heimdallarchaeota archaeon]MCK4291067.1 hypothetical protein [Candidatus Heimdallarchaeota archaeon]